MKKRIYMFGIAICVLLFCISMFQVIRHYANAQKYTEDFEKLAEIVGQSEESDEGTEEGAGGEEVSPLDCYQELFRQNHDLAGWISIEGTNINYPVMYTPDKPDFYLKHSFEKEYSDYGVPYIAGDCDPVKPSDNLIIYGHHIKGGKMFGALMDYTEKSFYEKHKTIRFDTLTEVAEYEVIAVFKTTVYGKSGFKYYSFVNAETEGDFDAYIKGCKELAFYDTGVSAEYGDKLITLSTCEYSAQNGRLVVVAKKIVE